MTISRPIGLHIPWKLRMKLTYRWTNRGSNSCGVIYEPWKVDAGGAIIRWLAYRTIFWFSSFRHFTSFLYWINVIIRQYDALQGVFNELSHSRVQLILVCYGPREAGPTESSTFCEANIKTYLKYKLEPTLSKCKKKPTLSTEGEYIKLIFLGKNSPKPKSGVFWCETRTSFVNLDLLNTPVHFFFP